MFFLTCAFAQIAFSQIQTAKVIGNTSEEAASMGGNRNITPEEFEKQIKSQYGPHAQAILKANRAILRTHEINCFVRSYVSWL